jgi:hypothetical protein
MGPTCPSAVHKRCQRGAGASISDGDRRVRVVGQRLVSTRHYAQQFDAEASLRAALNFAPPAGLAAGAYVSYCHAQRESR